MKIIESIHELQDYLEDFRAKGASIGFVPTMGALHEGHLSLLHEARNENELVVCSIFVNPIQFNNPNDLEKYPRNLEKDVEKLVPAGCDVLFHPSVEEMYPEPIHETYDFGDLDKVMEGKFRPGHFQGVAVVVKRLFDLVKPAKAYFGLKDYQQVVIVHALTKKYNIPVEIVPCPILREPNGLAMSSRNELLTNQQRNDAAIIYQALKTVRIRSGYSTIPEIHGYIERLFKKKKNFKLEYFEIVDMYSLKPLFSWTQSNNAIACIAVWCGNVRLIDNIILFS